MELRPFSGWESGYYPYPGQWIEDHVPRYFPLADPLSQVANFSFLGRPCHCQHTTESWLLNPEMLVVRTPVRTLH